MDRNYNNIYLNTQKEIVNEQKLLEAKIIEREKEELKKEGFNEDDINFYAQWGKEGRKKCFNLHERNFPRSIYLFCVNQNWSIGPIVISSENIYPILFESFEEAYGYCLNDFATFVKEEQPDSFLSFDVFNLDNCRTEVIMQGNAIKKSQTYYRNVLSCKYIISPVAFFAKPNSKLLISKDEKEKQIYEF